MSRAHVLELWETNVGPRYQAHCAAARMHRTAAREWVEFSLIAAREVMQTMDDDFPPFTAAEILEAAALLLAYYQRHNAESDALAASERGAT